ncbi:microviridin/marinostatin family tricyclic proteinase inhibitor [Sorangium sp. So ce233]|uniref:microviridin/marinostatin family tricyclic proteinase inhibitor n=1 Tax=Sorangium sp. So ce233 TaxID=3133290 RepID=UPI003F634854
MADVDLREPEQQEQEENAEVVPFFARFLEDQKRVRTGVKAGKQATTLKYPSDNEDGGGGGCGGDPIATTLKYPSDGDDI